ASWPIPSVAPRSRLGAPSTWTAQGRQDFFLRNFANGSSPVFFSGSGWDVGRTLGALDFPGTEVSGLVTLRDFPGGNFPPFAAASFLASISRVRFRQSRFAGFASSAGCERAW